MNYCLACNFSFDPKTSDTYDERFCNKFCEKKWCDENEAA